MKTFEVKARDLKAGDRIAFGAGVFRPVTAVEPFRNGTLPLLRVAFDRGLSAKYDPDDTVRVQAD